MKKTFLFLIPVFLLISCSSPRVVYDKNTDFSKYKTFAYYKKDMIAAELNKDYKSVIAFETDHILKSAGLVPSADPDLIVRIIPSFHERIDIYFDYWRFPPVPEKKKSLEGNLKIKLIDARTKKSVWETEFFLMFKNKNQLQRLLQKKLEKAFMKYPHDKIPGQ